VGDDLKIIDDESYSYITVTPENALLVEGISDLIALLTHTGATSGAERGLLLHDKDTGARFEVLFLGKLND